ncbi:MAG TPA: hypothetical protein GX742_00085 [Acholeplasmataceae bacterium]|nr:hypothetical protein [Acholeplasmataceae bacterium]
MKKYIQKNNKENYSNHWSTPKEIYNKYIENGYVDPNPLNSIIDPNTYDNDNKLFINPPYSNIKDFVKMAIRLHKKYNKEIILLVPSRTDTKWFHELLDYGIEIEFIKGRLKFGESKQSAPFPSIIIKIKGNKYERTNDHKSKK